MIKAVTIIGRKPEMSVAAFQEYWRGPHAEIVKDLPGLRRYVQSHPLRSGYGKRDLVHDGVAEVWVDDMKSLRAMSASPHYAAVQADEENFIHRTTMALVLTEEHVIKDGPAPPDGVKAITFLKRRPEMSVPDFQTYWREVHGPIAAQIPVLKRYVQSHTRLGGYRNGRMPFYDGLAIAWFNSTDAMRVSATTEEYARTRADEPNFLSVEDMAFIIAREHVIVD
ncbi:MAG: EthD family reductase [Minwuiales bacterium]|nr:EthD family reductase [Minwuiales bacterium]